MKLARIHSVVNFPFTEFCLEHACMFSDVYIRFDSDNGDQKMIDRIMKQNKTRYWGRIKKVIVSEKKFAKGDGLWMEEMLRLLDDVKPDIVLHTSHDGVFGPGLMKELNWFQKSDKQAMMFSIGAMISDDGRVPIKGRVYPHKPHMNVYKWKPGLTYLPYSGYIQVHPYAWTPQVWWSAKTKINRYCMFTKELEKEKIAHLKKSYPDNQDWFEGWE